MAKNAVFYLELNIDPGALGLYISNQSSKHIQQLGQNSFAGA
jgi:hypothetical protein